MLTMYMHGERDNIDYIYRERERGIILIIYIER